MKLYLALILCAAASGFCMAAPGGINGTLRNRLDYPLHSSLVSCVVGTIALVLICLVWTKSLPRPTVVVTSSLLMVPRIAATTWLASLICAQFAHVPLALPVRVRRRFAGRNERGIITERGECSHWLGQFHLVAVLNPMNNIETYPTDNPRRGVLALSVSPSRYRPDVSPESDDFDR